MTPVQPHNTTNSPPEPDNATPSGLRRLSAVEQNTLTRLSAEDGELLEVMYRRRAASTALMCGYI